MTRLWESRFFFSTIFRQTKNMKEEKCGFCGTKHKSTKFINVTKEFSEDLFNVLQIKVGENKKICNDKYRELNFKIKEQKSMNENNNNGHNYVTYFYLY